MQLNVERSFLLRITALACACFASTVTAQSTRIGEATPHRDFFASPADLRLGERFSGGLQADRADPTNLIHDPDPAVRSGAAYAIARTASSASIPTLHKMFEDDSNVKVRMNVLRALSSIPSPEIEPTLIKAIDANQPLSVRYEGYKALGSVQTDSSLNVLYRSLKDPSIQIRAAGLEALGRRGDYKAVPAIIELVKGQEPLISSQAAWALGEIGDPRAVPVLTDAVMKSRFVEVRRESAAALGRIADTKGQKALIGAAANKSEDLGVRLTALKSFGRIKWETKVPSELFTLATDGHVDVRAAAVHAIGMIKDVQSGSSVIRAAIKDPEPRVRLSAATAMALSPKDYLGSLVETSLDRGAFVELRIHSLTGLAALPTSELEMRGASSSLAKLLTPEEPIDVQLAAVNFFALHRNQEAVKLARRLGAHKEVAPEVKDLIHDRFAQ